MKKQKILAQAITLGLLLAIPYGVYAGELVLNSSEDVTKLYNKESGWFEDGGSRGYHFIYNQSNVVGNIITVDGKFTVKDAIYGAVTGGKTGDHGDANGNKLIISNVTLNQGATGGYAQAIGERSAIGNEVILTNVITSKNRAIYGAQSSDGIANNNKVTINGGEYKNAIYGATANGADGNIVTINSGTFYNRIHGVTIKKGIAENNKVILNAGSFEDFIYGARSNDTNESGESIYRYNSVIVNDEVTNIKKTIYGAWSGDYNVEENSVIIKGGENTEISSIYGGLTTNGNAIKNSVTINGGNFTDNIHGGFSEKGNVENNTVILNGGIFNSNIYGGSGNGIIKNNTIILSGNADVRNAKLFGYSSSGTSNGGNTLVIDGSWTGGNNIIGQLANFDNIGFTNIVLGNNLTVTSNNNNAKIDGDNINIDFSVIKDDNYTTGRKVETIIQLNKIALNNSAKINITNLDKDHAIITDNGVRVYGFKDVETKGPVNSNSDSITIGVSATVNKSVLAGSYTNDTDKFINSNNGSEIPPEKTIGGGELTIDSGFTTNAEIIAGAYGAGSNEAKGGKITVKADYSGTIYAGYSENGSVGDNTIVLDNVKAGSLNVLGSNKNDNQGKLAINGNSAINSVKGFKTLEFNGINSNNENAYLTINDGAKSSLKGTDVKLNFASGSAIGDKFKLISVNGGTLEGLSTNDKPNVGIGLEVTKGGFQQDGDIISYSIAAVQASSQTKTLTESRAAAAALVNQGADMVLDSIGELSDSDGGVQTFAAVSGSNSRYETGSHVDVNGWNTIVGVGNKKDNFAWGAFFENGDGNYSTFANNMRGDGNAVYNGAGVMGRYNEDNGMYYEASLHAGVLKNELNKVLVDNSTGKAYGYNIDTPYYGAHIGLGKVMTAGEGTVDAYAKYIYTHYDSDTIDMNGELFNMDSSDSNRLRLGLRYSQDSSDRLKLYCGAAWEYEFDGKANGNIQGYGIDEAGLKGGTIIGELGASYKASDKWMLDASLKGYGGTREGFSGRVQVNYCF